MNIEFNSKQEVPFELMAYGSVFKYGSSVCMRMYDIESVDGDFFNSVDVATGCPIVFHPEERVIPLEGKFMINW